MRARPFETMQPTCVALPVIEIVLAERAPIVPRSQCSSLPATDWEEGCGSIFSTSKPSGRTSERVTANTSMLYNERSGEAAVASGVRGLAVPATRLAVEAGSEKAANTVMLGVLLAIGATKLPEEAFRAAVADNFADKPKVAALNAKALNLAITWAKQHVSSH